MSEKLQKVSLKVWRQADYIRVQSNDSVILKDNMCIGQGDDKTTCAGGSGGPLVHFNQATRRWTNYGVTSFGMSTCTGSIPPVDTRVSLFVKWLWDTVAANSD